MTTKDGLTILIGLDLILVNRTVDLDHKACRRAIEVDDESTDYLLTSKMRVMQAVVSKIRP